MALHALQTSISRIAARQIPHTRATGRSRTLRISAKANGNGNGMGGHPEGPSFARSSFWKLGLTSTILLAVAHSAAASQAKNVLGGPLELCCTQPMTGFHRDGFCRVSSMDSGVHAVCAEITQEFLDYTASRGNDLSSVVKDGERWCLCASRWQEAKRAGKAPKIHLKATAAEALSVLTLEELNEYAIDAEEVKAQ